MKVLALLSVFLALPVAAQTAKYVQLSPEEAKQAKALYGQRDSAIKQIAELEKKLKTEYLTVKGGNAKDGWFNGFQYTEDFRIIVPSVPSYLYSTSTTLAIPATPTITTCPSNSWYTVPNSSGTLFIPNTGLNYNYIPWISYN